MAALAYLVACIIFVLAFLGVDVGDTRGLRLVALGLAFVAAGLLLPNAREFVADRRR